MRERGLRAGARMMIAARRITLAPSSAAAPFWAALWPRLMALQWADPQIEQPPDALFASKRDPARMPNGLLSPAKAAYPLSTLA